MKQRRLITSLNIMLLIFVILLALVVDWRRLLSPICFFFFSSLFANLIKVKTTLKAPILVIAFLFLFCYGWLLAFNPASELLFWICIFWGTMLGLVLGGLFHVQEIVEEVKSTENA